MSEFPNLIAQLVKTELVKFPFCQCQKCIVGYSCSKMHVLKERSENFLLFSFKSLWLGPLPLMESGSDTYKI